MTESKGKILVVDDEEIIRSGCKENLEMNDYSVDLAEDGLQGFEKVKVNDYDIVLTDIMMPGMDGMELLEKIQTLDKQVVVIVITGYATIESAITAGRKGAYDYLPKPFNPDEMLAKIERGLDYRNHLLEMKKLRQELDSNLLECHNERARTLTIINSMSEGVIAINRRQQIVLLNPVAAKIMRLSEELVVGRTVQEIIRNPELQKSIITSLEQVTSELRSTRLEFDTVSGRAIQANITPIIDESKQCIGCVSVLIDITEEKKVEKLKSDFVGYVSHELKAPLGAIEGYLNVILSGIITDNKEKEREMLENARNRAHGLIALINDLLDLSRTDRKASMKEMRALDVADLIRETIAFYKEPAESKAVSLKTIIAEKLPEIVGNKEDLLRLFNNIVGNAIKYTPSKGEVNIKVDRTQAHIKVEVIDSGVGISKEALKHIFDEFYRAKNALDKKISGTGLGLSIAKKIAEDHHGYIEAESQENKGSTFRIKLPVINKE